MSPTWKPAPKRGYIVCQLCFATVEDKGLKRAMHLTSRECQGSRVAPPTVPAREPVTDTGDANE